MKTQIVILIIILFSISITNAQITGSSGIRNALSLSQGNTSNASARGIYTSGINPANLVYQRNNTFEFSSTVLPLNLNLSVGNNLLTINDIIKYFTPIDSNGVIKRKVLSSSDIKEFKNYFSSDMNIYNTAHINWLSFYYKYNNKIPAISFSLDEIISGNIILPKDLPKSLVDLSFSRENQSLNLSNLNIKAWWLRSYTFNLGYSLNNIFDEYIKYAGLDELNIGFGVKYISGFAYSGFEQNNIKVVNRFDTASSNYLYSFNVNNSSNISLSDNFGPVYDYTEISIRSHIPKQIFPKEAGRGYGYDFGFNIRFLTSHIFSFAVTDIGKIKWFKNTANYSAVGSFNYSGIPNGNIKQIQDSLQRALDTLDKFIPYQAFYTKLPTTIRLGYAFQVNQLFNEFPGIMNLAFDLNFGLNNMPDNSTKPRFSCGFNWNISENIPYIRSGISTGGKYGFLWSVGTGLELDWYSFDFGMVNLHHLLKKNRASKLLISFSNRIRL